MKSPIVFLKRLINHLFVVWLNKRLPAQSHFVLNRTNTFIFPSKFGLHFLLLLFILFLLGTNYQNNLILFMVFFLCSFMLTCLLLSYFNLAGLTLNVGQADAQFAGQDITFRLRLLKQVNRAEQIHFHFQNSSSPLESVINEKQVLLYALSNKRGLFDPKRVTVSSTFPFGLFRVWTHLDFGFSSIVYPAPLVKEYLFNLAGEKNNSAFNQMESGFEQFSTLKPYQQGESLKLVAWKQLAQGRGWFSKQFEQNVGADIVLDIALYADFPLETKLSILCYQVLALDEKGESYCLKLGNKEIAYGQGKLHKQRCLKALALYE